MIFSLFCIILTILWIVLGTSITKLHPFLVLFSAALLLAFLLGLPPSESLKLIKKGFGGIVEKIGLLILFGTVIGVAMEQSGATIAIARGILKKMNRLPLPYAISSIGYLVSIPVFCDAAFVILSHLNKTLSQQTKTPLVGLSVALSTGLFAPHVLVPPTPGPLAGAANLELENLFLLIVVGAIIAFILILVGGTYGYYLIKKNKYQELKKEKLEDNSEIQNMPSFTKAILPILIPIILMCLGALLKFFQSEFTGFEYILLITKPTMALGIGMLFSFSLIESKRKVFLNNSVKKGLIQSAPIIVITGMGGALGAIIQTIPLKTYAESIMAIENLGIIIPFLISALLKSAQGSSTVAIITTSSLIFPLLPLLGLDSEMGKIWTIMALGVGSMTVSHANDSYFWIVTQMSGMDVKTAYKTHTLGTFIQGVTGLLVILIGHWIWTLI
jgi:GntP family gluconate:H+ symporter